MSYSEIGLELVKVVITALLAAVLVHLLERRRFVQGRWWDRKAKAYGKIIGALIAVQVSVANLKGIGDVLEEVREYGVKTLGENGVRLQSWLERKQFEHLDHLNEAMAQVTGAFFEGEYGISRRASDVLVDSWSRIAGPPPLLGRDEEWEECFESVLTVTEACLEVVREEALKDLRVK